ncbi:hypothetical protein [Spirillospora sp. CA-294931]|uniref:hypothetical protein n=1 Tax=Spirillospora sp. CA-294931 TaxID=3240042 RepID=UPI003D89CF2B
MGVDEWLGGSPISDIGRADDPNIRLEVLEGVLKLHGYAPVLRRGDGTNKYLAVNEHSCEPAEPYRVFCRPRASEGEDLWFYEDHGKAFAAAHDLAGALKHIKQHVPVPQTAGEGGGA